MLKKYGKTLATLVAATVILGAMVGTASARRLASSSGTIRAAWTELIFSGSGATITCPVTLEGSLHERTIDKTPEALIGYITRVIVGEGVCRGGGARALTETLPWHVRYGSFEGRLPDIEAITARIINANFQIRATIGGIPVSCLYTTSGTSPATGRFSRNTATRAITGVAAAGSIRSNTFGCPNGGFAGTGTVTELGTSNAITVTLI